MHARIARLVSRRRVRSSKTLAKAGVAWAMPSVGCAIHPVILQIAAGLYVAYGALFVQLFVNRYVKPKAGAGGGGAKAEGAADDPNAAVLKAV